MSFVLNGTTYYQPTDKTIVSYSGTKYVLVANGDTIERVLMSEFAQGGCDTGCDVLSLSGAYAVRLQPGDTSNHMLLGAVDNPHIFLPGKGYSSVQGRLRTHNNLNAITWQTQTDGTYAFCAFGNALPSSSWPWNFENEQTRGRIRAYSFNTYACDRRNKRAITKIDTSKLRALNGIEYTDLAGKRRAGITAQDLEASGIPETVFKDEKGEYEAINTTQLIPFLLEAVNELTNEVNALKQLQRG